MITLREDFSLKNFNSFRIEAKARYFAEADMLHDLLYFIKHKPYTHLPVMVLGEGSNILFKSDYDGIIIHPLIKGIEIIREDPNCVFVKAGAGENWDCFVAWAVKQQFGGIENLSLIPGSVGACPVQNIGAYGAEASEVIESVETIDLQDGKSKTISGSECNFGYRTSIFKTDLKGKIIINAVVFRLSKSPVLKTGYGMVKEKLNKYKDVDISIMRTVVSEIRRERLPDPSEIGNAGSFFKNPVITEEEFSMIHDRFPEIPSHQAEKSGCRKISAAWLIEECGWKGRRTGNTGTYPTQTLVLVNYGNASGQEILELSEEIARNVLEKFNIRLEREVNVV